MRKRGLQLGVRNVNNAIHSLWSFRPDFTQYWKVWTECLSLALFIERSASNIYVNKPSESICMRR